MKLLAFDTSTEHLSIAVQHGDARWAHQGAGGAQSSATLIPAALGLLAQAGLTLDALDAIVFGRGPGSFTGLRTACAVAQGLAFGAGVPVLPVDTLMAVAEDARMAHGATRVLALLDARMNEVYAAAWQWAASGWQFEGPARAYAPEAVAPPPGDGWVLAGNAFAVYGERFAPALQPLRRVEALPTAGALLSLAPGLLAAGCAVEAAQALPVYIRDKVAQTTAERAAASAR